MTNNGQPEYSRKLANAVFDAMEAGVSEDRIITALLMALDSPLVDPVVRLTTAQFIDHDTVLMTAFND